MADAAETMRSEDRLQAIAGEVPLLGSLPASTRQRLLEGARIERFPAGAGLFEPGEFPDCMHVVLSGIVDLCCTYKGHDCTAFMMASGDVLMPAAALHEEPYLVVARALTATRLLIIDAKRLRSEAQQSAELALNVGRIVAGQWRMALKIILDLKCRSPSQRLAAFLLRLHDARTPGTLAEVPFSKRQLASRIGMQPETLSRTLQTLAGNGLYLRGRQIIVNDRAQIEAFCGPDPYPTASEYEFGVHAL